LSNLDGGDGDRCVTARPNRHLSAVRSQGG